MFDWWKKHQEERAREEEAERIVKRLDGREEKEKEEAEREIDQKLAGDMIQNIIMDRNDKASEVLEELIKRKLNRKGL